MDKQERDTHGRYSHRWEGVVAQNKHGDVERCSGCGALRDGRGRRIKAEKIAADEWLS